MENWKKRIWEHLEEYKVAVLGIPGKGIEGDREYGHILPCGTHFMNYMGESALSQSNLIKRHPGWHHLSSSQTMCLNFFAPMVESKDYELLNRFLSLLGIEAEIKEAKFEHTPVKNGTNFDFFCRDKDGKEYYFEIKYTEPDVSKEGGGKHPDETFRIRYLPFVENNPVFAHCEDIETLFMKKHYQAYRNIMMANEKNYSFFITMEGNDGTETELKESISDLKLTDGEGSHIVHLHWEHLIPEWISVLSEKDGKGKNKYPEMQGYYREFARKYLLK